jgi:hypothetical protein
MTTYQRLREATKGMAQQMILWGHDVEHPQGNAILRFGMERSESLGLKGTSCYTMTWENGHVQLHGAIACWFGDRSEAIGCVYRRASQRLKCWHHPRAPIPGEEDGCYASPEIVWRHSQPFLRWLIAYETFIASELGIAWCHQSWRAQFSLTKKNPWLPRHEALAWWKHHVQAEQQVA